MNTPFLRLCGSAYVIDSHPDVPRRIADLAGRRVALWGWGREGRAAHLAIRSRLPLQRLRLFCSPSEAIEASAMADPLLEIETTVDAQRLGECDVVIKSPGISLYHEDVQAAGERGSYFLGGTALWFGERPDADTLCVTGTKGKSTTTALLAHLLRAAGQRTALAGNIGLPLLELLEAHARYWAIELSSYQTRDVAASGVRPHLAIATNIHPEHLDWHGSQARYIEDKLALFTEARPHLAVLNAEDVRLRALHLPDSQVHWYGQAEGWHLRGDIVFRGANKVLDTRLVPLPGRHNRSNLCAVLTALEAIGLDAQALAAQAQSFAPLPNRLQVLGVRDGLVWVNDSISTTPQASLAALAVYAGQRVALLIGGHDRGLDWSDFAEAMQMRAPLVIVTMGENGPRIQQRLQALQPRGFTLAAARDLPEAVERARAALAVPSARNGVVLLSPGAPSFDAYPGYEARGRHFAQLAGFEPGVISAIPGLGVS